RPRRPCCRPGEGLGNRSRGRSRFGQTTLLVEPRRFQIRDPAPCTGLAGRTGMRPRILDLLWARAFASLFVLTAALGIALPHSAFAQDDFAAVLPKGINAVWNISKAYRETTPTRERICINGLWRWQPTLSPGNESPLNGTNGIPRSRWGYF